MRGAGGVWQPLPLKLNFQGASLGKVMKYPPLILTPRRAKMNSVLVKADHYLRLLLIFALPIIFVGKERTLYFSLLVIQKSTTDGNCWFKEQQTIYQMSYIGNLSPPALKLQISLGWLTESCFLSSKTAWTLNLKLHLFWRNLLWHRTHLVWQI